MSENPEKRIRWAAIFGLAILLVGMVACSNDDGAAHNSLGLALQEQGKLDEAIEQYRTAIRLDPEDALTHSFLGDALYAQGKLDEATEQYRTTIQLDRLRPMPPRGLALAHNNLGIALKAQGKGDEAERAFARARELGWPGPQE